MPSWGASEESFDEPAVCGVFGTESGVAVGRRVLGRRILCTDGRGLSDGRRDQEVHPVASARGASRGTAGVILTGVSRPDLGARFFALHGSFFESSET